MTDQRLTNDPAFRRLKLGGLGLASRTSYWLGRDHLLLVEVSNYNERYRRLFFRDIQAVIVQTTHAQRWWNFGLAVLTVLSLFGIGLAWTAAEPPTSIVGVLIFASGFGVLALLGVIGFVLNFLRGPTCAAYVRTAVQNQRLRGLSRWRKAEELMRELAPLILSAQATLPETATSATAPSPDALSPGELRIGPVA